MSHPFKPMKGFSHAHFQTIFPTLLKRNYRPKFIHEVLELPDGDRLDLAWQHLPTEDDRPIVVLFHGLEGSVLSPYAYGMMEALDEKGLNAVVMHFRGCYKTPNRLARAYHSGETADARFFLEQLHQKFPLRPLAAIGFSLGGNMLMKLQGEWGDDSLLFAAVSVSAPLKLEETADYINHGSSRFYQWYLMQSLRESLLQKYEDHDYEALIGLKLEDVPKLKNFWEYDDLFTGPIHGFEDAKEYYEKSSASQYLSAIRRPTLIIHAEDDPFMPVTVLPDPTELPKNIEIECSKHGGHVGFLGGTILKPEYWLQSRVPEYLLEKLPEKAPN